MGVFVDVCGHPQVILLRAALVKVRCAGPKDGEEVLGGTRVHSMMSTGSKPIGVR